MWSLNLYKQSELPKLWMSEAHHHSSHWWKSQIQDPTALLALLLVWFPLFASSNLPLGLIYILILMQVQYLYSSKSLFWIMSLLLVEHFKMFQITFCLLCLDLHLWMLKYDFTLSAHHNVFQPFTWHSRFESCQQNNHFFLISIFKLISRPISIRSLCGPWSVCRLYLWQAAWHFMQFSPLLQLCPCLDPSGKPSCKKSFYQMLIWGCPLYIYI